MPSKLKYDLAVDDCSMLVDFVRSLPPPVLRYDEASITQSWGYTVFETVGCATCHAPRLGRVNGIYSDLLLHDMGDRMRASGGYGSPSVIVDKATNKDKTQASGEAAATEWRTAPLWGVATSKPYLHDGRADTLDEAIRLHGGEAAATSERYAKLSTIDHNALILFLRSLTVSAVRPTKHTRDLEQAKRGEVWRAVTCSRWFRAFARIDERYRHLVPVIRDRHHVTLQTQVIAEENDPDEDPVVSLWLVRRRFDIGGGLALGLVDEPAQAPLPKAYLDGTGPGWRALGEEDFVNVNCNPETWSWKGGEVHCTGQPVGVTRTKRRWAISSWWRSGGIFSREGTRAFLCGRGRVHSRN